MEEWLLWKRCAYWLVLPEAEEEEEEELEPVLDPCRAADRDGRGSGANAVTEAECRLFACFDESAADGRRKSSQDECCHRKSSSQLSDATARCERSVGRGSQVKPSLPLYCTVMVCYAIPCSGSPARIPLIPAAILE